MKNLFLAATAIVSAVTFTTAARAADIAPAAYDWSGFYFGLNAGAAWNNSEIDNSFEYTGGDIEIVGGPPPEVLADDINDALDAFEEQIGGDDAVFTGGALIGYNWQHDSLVFGVEADINYADFSDEISREFNDVDLPFITGDLTDGSSNLSFDANWFGTLRGRLGFAADNFLIYGTGGLAYGHLEASADIDLIDDGGETVSYEASTDATNWGWTAGAGVEYGIGNWSLGLEYLYVDLGSAEWNADLDETVADGNISDALALVEGSGNVDYQFSVVRATAKIRF
jgi:outer membrane immunogenic protein